MFLKLKIYPNIFHAHQDSIQKKKKLKNAKNENCDPQSMMSIMQAPLPIIIVWFRALNHYGPT